MPNVNIIAPFPEWFNNNDIRNGFPTPTSFSSMIGGKLAIQLEHNEPTVALGGPADREVIGQFVPCKPNDRIVFKAKLMAEVSTIGDSGSNKGAIMAMDLYDVSGSITQIATAGGATYEFGPPEVYPDMSSIIAPWGTMAWKQITIDFIVKNEYESSPWNTANVPAGTLRSPTGFILGFFTFCTDPVNERAKIWATDPELYINPTPMNLTIPLVVLASTALGLGVSRMI